MQGADFQKHRQSRLLQEWKATLVRRAKAIPCVVCVVHSSLMIRFSPTSKSGVLQTRRNYQVNLLMNQVKARWRKNRHS